ncbi:glycoside hydrolase family 99-like domain-containing protein [Dolichospermum circinale]|uniref:glycosyltransferase WbsX family protein n=1 Tax=Dolichospermum circinale TaxID=109265 RepID=UPI002330DCF6|nr:glycoside hydrolase family 99-like domain-containing protein [Dolichospermum circinale]MDB9450659.1 glycoside hydrolase family 99-like domain-containing protein [Dolichospermum circinale CS-547]
MSKNPKLIAFYLTQFHPIPENDEWWGKGFTEWTNVTKAEALYNGHYQPHLPADFGFYDLRVRETRQEQIKLAKQFGIEGFCYHYYWFSGKRLLEKPFNDMLADPKSDMPFCICWANENWTRRWDAAEHQILIAQNYTDEDDLNFIKDLIPVIKDSRYIRINDAPFIIVYRPQQLPNANKTLAVWREYARSVGIEKLHLCAALTHGNTDYSQFGFDSGVEFPPHNLDAISISNDNVSFYNKFLGHVIPYELIAKSYLSRRIENQLIFKTVFPSWDNTARRGSRALIVPNGTPSNYEYWLAQSIELTKNIHKNQESFVFINAWNEWAEGCHLEPDRKYGNQFLEATLRAASNSSTLIDFPDKAVFKMEKRKFLTDTSEVVFYHFSMLFTQIRSWFSAHPKLKTVLRLPILLIGRLNSSGK